MTLYNEIEPFAAGWLRNLMDSGEIPEGTVDVRSIADLQAADLTGFRDVHFFAGIGGWPLALKLAGWPDDRQVWTGSCPCQPFSSAGKGEGTADERHLWPEMFRLIRECRPAIVFGEQVASKAGLGWLDGVFADLEGAGYDCGAADLCAAGVGSPQIRQRLFWVACTNGGGHDGRKSSAIAGKQVITVQAETGGVDGGLACTDIAEFRGLPSAREQSIDESDRGTCGLEHGESDRRNEGRPEPDGGSTSGGRGTKGDRQEGREAPGQRSGGPVPSSAFSDYEIIRCSDGKSRRVGRGIFPLAHGIPRDVGQRFPELRSLAKGARGNRVGRLKGYGNAIVPELAAEFIRTVMEVVL